MLGFGKKKQTSETEEEKISAAPAITSASVMGEENFIIMPEKFLPKKGGGKKNTGRLIGILLILFVFLAGLSGGLYYFLAGDSGFFQKNNDQPKQISSPPSAPSPQPPESQEGEKKNISAQAYDETNQLLGAVSLIIPPAVFDQFGASIGAAVLNKQDLSLPEGGQIAGGIYSLYPVGVDFGGLIEVQISQTGIETTTPANLAPAWLRGITWEQVKEASLIDGIFSFSLAKFSPSPLALVYSAPADEIATSSEAAVFTSSPDNDQDGLTDKEENLLGTNLGISDTDEDSYGDKSEIMSGYSPLGLNQKLEETRLFSTFTNPVYGYKVTHPSSWLADSLDQTNKQVLFISETAEFFEILVEENPLNTPIVDWYRSQSPASQAAELQVTIIDGRPGVWSPDGLTLYTSKDGLIFIITYNRGTLDEINWPSFYELFYQSFRFGNTSSS